MVHNVINCCKNIKSCTISDDYNTCRLGGETKKKRLIGTESTGGSEQHQHKKRKMADTSTSVYEKRNIGFYSKSSSVLISKVCLEKDRK